MTPEEFKSLVETTMKSFNGMTAREIMACEDGVRYGFLKGVAAEREACAKVIESLGRQMEEDMGNRFIWADEAAAAIRARSNAKDFYIGLASAPRSTVAGSPLSTAAGGTVAVQVAAAESTEAVEPSDRK